MHLSNYPWMQLHNVYLSSPSSLFGFFFTLRNNKKHMFLQYNTRDTSSTLIQELSPPPLNSDFITISDTVTRYNAKGRMTIRRINASACSNLKWSLYLDTCLCRIFKQGLQKQTCQPTLVVLFPPIVAYALTSQDVPSKNYAFVLSCPFRINILAP